MEPRTMTPTFRRLSLLLASLGLLACPAAPLPDPLEPAPRVVSFTGSAQEVDLGGSVTLTWAVENAASLRIDELKLGSISGVEGATGTVDVAVTENALFVLTARNERGASDTAVVAVRVRQGGAAGTVLFTALPQQLAYGDSATLAWSAPGARAVTLTAEPGGAIEVGTQVTSGSVAVTPEVSTTYTLTVDGRASTATVTVAPAILSFSGSAIAQGADAGAPAADAGVDAGTPTQPVTLRWKAAGGTRAEISAPGRGTLFTTTDGAEVAAGTFTDAVPAAVDPSALFSYRLTVTSGGTTVTRDLVLSVSGRPAVLTFSAPALVRASTDGGVMALAWTTSDADALSLSANGVEFFRATGGQVAAGTVEVPTPAADTTYQVTATNSRGGRATRSATVDVVGVPTVTATASPSSAMAGQEVTISWTGEHIREVRVRLQGVGVISTQTGVLDTGSAAVSVADTSTLTVEADNGLGDVATANVMVTVANPFTFTQAPAGALRAGQDLSLSWTGAGEAAGFAHGEVLTRSPSTGFDDISQTGTRLTFVDRRAAFEPNFRMPFFDRIVGSQVWVSANGYLTFAGYVNGDNSTEVALPTSKLEPYSIAPNWDFFSTASTATVHWQVKPTGSGQVLIVQWSNMNSSTYQVKCYSSGQVDLEFLTYGGAGVAGIQGPRGDWGWALPSARAANKGFTFFGPVPSPLRTTVQYERPLLGTLVLGNREMLVRHAPAAVVRPTELYVGEAMVLPAAPVGPAGRWFELVNARETALDLTGWELTGTDGGVFALSGSVPGRGTLVLGASTDPALNDDAGVQLELTGFDPGPAASGSLRVGRLGALSTYTWSGPDAGIARVVDPGPFRIGSATAAPQACAATDTFGFQSPLQRGTPGRAAGCGFGYGVREIPGGFFDISRTGTMATVTDYDESYATLSLAAAPFPWFGTPRVEARISTNGFLTFDMVSSDNDYFPLSYPETGNINDVVAPFWDDLEGVWTTSEIYTQRVGANVDPAAAAPHWIIQWHDWSFATTATSADHYFFQVKLFDDGTIEFHYGDMESGSSSQYGSGSSANTWIENSTGTQALVVNTQSLTPGISPYSAFRFSPR
jgi:hypothetical protein